MASFLKLFQKKNKPEDKPDPEDQRDPEQRDRRLKKQLSISRSGRYKQKNRQRGAIADRSDLFQPEAETQEPSRETKVGSSGHSQSPNNSCREVNGMIIPGRMRRNEQIAS